MQIGSSQFGSDLIALEELHLLKLGVWAALSILIGSGLIASVRIRRAESPLLQHFGIQCAAWGAIDLLIVWWAGRNLEIRDLAGAVALDRFVWLNIGLDIGYVMVGATLALCGWKFGRRLGLVGAGFGVIVQGLALTVLDLQLSAGIVR
jgi:hypothetical protein